MATNDSERQLMEAGGWFDTLVTHAPIPKLVHTLDGERVLALSDAFTALTGYTLEDIPTGLDWMMRVRGLDREAAKEAVEEAVAIFRAGPPFPEQEAAVFTKSGERRTWLFHVAGVLAGAEGVRFVVTSAIDITQRKHAEERLLAHQRFVDAIFATNPNVLYVFDLRRQAPIYQNRHVAKAVGYSAEEVRAMGTRVLETLAHPDDLPKIQAHFQRIATAEDGELHSHEHRMRHRDGSWRWFYAQDTIFARDESGTPTQIIGTSTDITAQKRAELALAESRRDLEASEARYRAVVEDIPMLLCRFDPEGRITFVNRAYCEAFGRPEEELLGQPVLSLVPEEDRDTVWRALASLSPERPTMTVEHRVTARNGRERWQRWTNRVIFGGDVGVVAYQSIGEDITDEVEARREREALQRELRRHRYQLGQALKAAQAGAWTWETETNRFFWSPETYDMLGMAPSSPRSSLGPPISWATDPSSSRCSSTWRSTPATPCQTGAR